MNDVIHALLNRRSIRKFLDKPVEADKLEILVKTGLYAPSSKNIQPWHLTVILNPDVIAALTAEVKAALVRARIERYQAQATSATYSVNFGTAPVFIIVSANPDITLCAAEDSSLVLGNLLLSAYALGLGGCWVNQLTCITDEPQFRTFLTTLGVPQTHKIYGAAAFGYPEGPHPEASPRREGVVNYVR